MKKNLIFFVTIIFMFSSYMKAQEKFTKESILVAKEPLEVGNLPKVLKSSEEQILMGNSNIFEFNTKIGIGTVEPNSILDIDCRLLSGNENGVTIRADLPLAMPFPHTLSLVQSSNSESVSLGFGENDHAVIRTEKIPNNDDYKLEFWVRDSDSPLKYMSIFPNGNVGIGTKNNNPVRKLHLAETSNDDLYLHITNDQTGHEQTDGLDIGLYQNAGIIWQRENSPLAFYIGHDNEADMVLSNKLLQVDGKIECEEIQVTDVGADYVFDDNYKLRSLKEIEQYIKQHKHLPGIPPSSETEKGVNLGEFNEILLEKIEELTLYTIELQKQIEYVKSENTELKKIINKTRGK